MIRVIASDYDGTFGTHLGIPAENIEAVRRWQKAGNIFCVLTGREPLSAIDVLKQFGGVYDYLLACSGAVQMDAQNEIFHMEKQSAHLLPEIASYTLTLPVLNFRVFVGKERHRLYIPGREHDSEAGNLTPEDLGKLPYFNQFSLLFDTNEQAQEYCDTLNARYGTYINALRNNNCVDVPMAGFDKTVGLRHFLEALHIPPEQAVTVGDNCNDVQMIRAFSGYAVKNGVPELKAAAHGVVDSVAALIDQLLQENGAEMTR